MDTLKTTYNWAKWIVVDVLPKTAKWLAIAYVVVAVAYTSLKIDGSAHQLPFIDDPTIPAEQMDYKQWVNARAEWLKEQNEFESYMDNEAESAVNIKASDQMKNMEVLHEKGVDSDLPTNQN